METQVQKEIKMKQSSVDSLRQAAKQDPVLHTICSAFAKRERARGQVTIVALRQTMKKEGISFPKQDYDRVLSTLAKLGFGNLKKDLKGNIKALTDVKVTLQSIGKAAVTKDQIELSKYKSQSRNKFQPLESEKPTTPRSTCSVALTVTIDGKEMVIPGPSNIKPEDLGKLLINFNNIAPKDQKGNA